MGSADDPPPVPDYTASDQLRHELKTPLTTMHGHVQLLGRAVRRSPSLAESERARMLASLAAIETAIHAQLAVIETIGEPPHTTED